MNLTIPPPSTPNINRDYPDDDDHRIFDISDDVLKDLGLTQYGIDNLRNNFGLGKKLQTEGKPSATLLQKLFHLSKIANDRDPLRSALEIINRISAKIEKEKNNTKLNDKDFIAPYVCAIWSVINALAEFPRINWDQKIQRQLWQSLFVLVREMDGLKTSLHWGYKTSKHLQEFNDKGFLEVSLFKLCSTSDNKVKEIFQEFYSHINTPENYRKLILTAGVISAPYQPSNAEIVKLVDFIADQCGVNLKLSKASLIFLKEKSKECRRRLSKILEALHTQNPIFHENKNDLLKVLTQQLKSDKRQNISLVYDDNVSGFDVFDIALLKAIHDTKKFKHLICMSTGLNELHKFIYGIIRKYDPELTINQYEQSFAGFWDNPKTTEDFLTYILDEFLIEPQPTREAIKVLLSFKAPNMIVGGIERINELKKFVNENKIQVHFQTSERALEFTQSNDESKLLIDGDQSSNPETPHENSCRIAIIDHDLRRKLPRDITAPSFILRIGLTAAKNLGLYQPKLNKKLPNSSLNTLFPFKDSKIQTNFYYADHELDPGDFDLYDFSRDYDLCWLNIRHSGSDDNENQEYQATPNDPQEIETPRSCLVTS